MEFRKLYADEIDCRIATINEKGLTLLLYKDARVDQRILDEVVGCENWQRSHEVINGNLFCNVGIYIANRKEWVWKQDVGTESYTEKEKGQASDAFKRACFNWGIGRELYSAPFIWISASDANITEKNGKYACYDKFIVDSITYNEKGDISTLAIVNTKTGKQVYYYNNTKADDTISKAYINNLKNLCVKKGVAESSICERYKVESIDKLNNVCFDKAMKILNGMPDKE